MRYPLAGIYIATHVALGIAARRYHIIIPGFLVYQMWQLSNNKRVFIDQGRIEDGNSVEHTGHKLFQFACGILLGVVLFPPM